MSDISVTGLYKSYGDNLILEDVSFEIFEGQRVGLAGANGSGKTTLFKILGGMRFDKGSVVINKDRRVGILDQIPSYPAGMTAEEVVMTGFADLHDVKRRMDEITAALESESGDGDALRRYGALEARYEHMGGYESDVLYKKVIGGLGIPPRMEQMDFNLLSGGEKTRVNLARMLVMQTDILLLDEPTNHLDLSATEWLEQYLAAYKGTILLVSHDRYFLDNITTRTLELERRALRDWPGNYSWFAQAKEDDLQRREMLYERQQKEAARLAFTAQRMRGWGTNDRRMMRRAIALERRIERIKSMDKPNRVKTRLSGSFNQAARSGNDALLMLDIHKSFGDKTVLDGIDLDIKKDEAVAVIGENGSGKTTLLNILLGNLAPDRGEVRFGSNIKTAYLPQIVEFDHPERTVLDTLLFTLDITAAEARDRLGAYNFKGEDVFKPVSALSGGERSRLKLCVVMYGAVNFLILDEPTNHLDIASREWIEAALEDFDGTMIFVSHDRYFLNRFATRVVALGDGKIDDFHGIFAEYREKQAKLAGRTATPTKIEAAPVTVKAELAPKGIEDKVFKKNRREVEKQVIALEREISAAEEEISALEYEMGQNADDHEQLMELEDERQNKNKQMGSLLVQWEQACESLQKLDEV